MLEIKIEHFLDYCKVSNFATRSIQSLRVRLNEFNRFIKKTSVDSVKGISYRHLKVFITQYHNPSIHIKKARIWSLRQFFHFLKLNGWVDTNTASDFPYPKIEKTIPHFLTFEYHWLLLCACPFSEHMEQHFFVNGPDNAARAHLGKLTLMQLLIHYDHHW
ncbi:hypothetical protein [Desulfobacula toluolica]|uniref:Putative integrase/recombinase, XerC/CodV family n=1 Tax=Desulfobacula toluolica (strain DSM 7467 / Tol2) TaxID=651182 RepID=K0NC39_DESTT|nr:hypothetical protein [Desulfobacula toluolica]CCK78356.1 putative integrase/recombinase, XerC/CodV family [Desulfobacula toluolica Tol2]